MGYVNKPVSCADEILVAFNGASLHDFGVGSQNEASGLPMQRQEAEKTVDAKKDELLKPPSGISKQHSESAKSTTFASFIHSGTVNIPVPLVFFVQCDGVIVLFTFLDTCVDIM